MFKCTDGGVCGIGGYCDECPHTIDLSVTRLCADKTKMKLILNIDHSGETLFLQTPDGTILPNIVDCELPKQFPHEYENGFPLVKFTFILQDIDIRTIDIDEYWRGRDEESNADDSES